MIRLPDGTSLAGSFTATAMACKLATEKNEDVCVVIFGRECIAHPGDNPHERYEAFCREYRCDS